MIRPGTFPRKIRFCFFTRYLMLRQLRHAARRVSLPLRGALMASGATTPQRRQLRMAARSRKDLP
jgi:hypothetical protein